MSSAAAALSSQVVSPPLSSASASASSPKLEYVHLQSMLTATTTTTTTTTTTGVIGGRQEHIAAHSPWLTLDLGPLPPAYHHLAPRPDVDGFPAGVKLERDSFDKQTPSRSPSALLVHTSTISNEGSASCRPSDAATSAADEDQDKDRDEDENVHARRDPASPPKPDADALAITANAHTNADALPKATTSATLASRSDSHEDDLTSTATSLNTNIADTNAPPASRHPEPELASHPHPRLPLADMSPTGDAGDRRASCESYDQRLAVSSSPPKHDSTTTTTLATASTKSQVQPQQQHINGSTFAAPALSPASREAPPSTVVGAPLQRVRHSATSDGAADDAIAVRGRGASHAILRRGRDGSLGGSGRLDDTHTQGSAGRGDLGERGELEGGGRSQDVAGSAGSAGMDTRTTHTRASFFLFRSVLLCFGFNGVFCA